jgi:hypothetical protein
MDTSAVLIALINYAYFNIKKDLFGMGLKRYKIKQGSLKSLNRQIHSASVKDAVS